MTLCIAAVCQDRGRDRIVIATDWKAGTDEAAAENEDKLYWITDDAPVMIAGTITRAVDLKNTYAAYFERMNSRVPPRTLTTHNVSDTLRKPLDIYRRKLADEHMHKTMQMSYRAFLDAVGKKQVPRSVAVERFAELVRLELEAELIICMFGDDGTAFVYKVNDAGLELCNNFAAIGSGSAIAEGSLYSRKQDQRMTVGTTLYNVYEAMKLGSISPTVGEEHTLNVLRNFKKGETVLSTMCEPTKATNNLLDRAFRKYGPKPMRGLRLPKGALETSN